MENNENSKKEFFINYNLKDSNSNTRNEKGKKINLKKENTKKMSTKDKSIINFYQKLKDLGDDKEKKLLEEEEQKTNRESLSLLDNVEKMEKSNKISTSKYTWVNFIFKILLEQFKKMANFYFLIIALMQCINEISISQGKPVILLPLSFVILVNGIKDFLEDYKRRKSDNEENDKISLVYSKEKMKFEGTKWENIKLGDIVKVKKDEYFPADIVLINTSEKEGECFIETKNLDGETNLKFKQANFLIKSIFSSENNLNDFIGTLRTSKPNQHIYEFSAILNLDEIECNNLKKLATFEDKKSIRNKGNDNINVNKFDLDLIKEDKLFGNSENDNKSKSINEEEFCEIKSNNENDNDNDYLKKNELNKIKNLRRNNDDKILIDKSSFLLRGCSLKNSEYIIGVCVYLGHSTKIMINSEKARYKSSKLDDMMNKQICIILIFQFILSTISAIFNHFWVNDNLKNLSYIIDNQNKIPFFKTIFGIGTWILIFTNLVPISLLVSLEMIKFIQGQYISWDHEIYEPKDNIPAKVQTSTLNEELGQVKYIFTDKTGTLTKNYMEFQEMSIGEFKYGEMIKDKAYSDKYGQITNFNCFDENLNKEIFDENCENYENIINFFTALATCHSINVEKDKNNNFIYHSSSPDETAFINCARNFGFIYHEKDCKNNIYLEIQGKTEKVKLLNVIEYTSESIILQMSNGDIKVFSKGADSIITSKLSYRTKHLKKTKDYLSGFARKGLRTLMIAYRNLDEDFYTKWNKKYQEAFTSEIEKNKLIDDLHDEMEKDLLLLGSTAINDDLQDDLKETLDFFIKTGVKLWVLTGDKFDTAKSIAFSSKLISPFNKLYEFNEINNKEELEKKLNRCLLDYDKRENKNKEKNEVFESNKNSNGNKNNSLRIFGDEVDSFNISKDNEQDFDPNEKTKYSIIIGSEQLQIMLSDKELENKFYLLSIRCSSVVCCRVSPKQKAEMVNLIKSRQPLTTTLAIGDGANDVNMICTAHVGIGIYGVEGRQASRASDYSIAKFSYLKKLMYVHGRESYRKNSFVVCYNFYKNMLFVIPQFWFGFSSGFSGQPLYDPWIYQLYNVTFTCLPIIWYGIYDKEESYTILMEKWKYYHAGIVGKLFHSTRFWKWVLYGALQAYFVYYFCYLPNDGIMSNKGFVTDLYSQGSLVYFTVVVIVNFKILYSTSTHTFYSIILVLGSIGSYIICSLFLNFVKSSPISSTFGIIMSSWNTLLITLVLCIVCLILDSGVNKTLQIFGFMTDAAEIHLDDYERKEFEKDGFGKIVMNIDTNNLMKDDDDSKEEEKYFSLFNGNNNGNGSDLDNIEIVKSDNIC